MKINAIFQLKKIAPWHLSSSLAFDCGWFCFAVLLDLSGALCPGILRGDSVSQNWAVLPRAASVCKGTLTAGIRPHATGDVFLTTWV